MTRFLVRCVVCGGAWLEETDTTIDALTHVRLTVGHPCTDATFVAESIAYDPALRSCRESEPRSEIGVGLRYPKPGECGVHCRGSVSPGCACPVCKGTNHGELRLAKPAEPGALDTLYDGIEAAKPRGDWPGRKST